VKIAVVTFPGSNCDQDALHVAKNVLGAKTHSVWHKDASLPQGTDLVILPGGFSYGDALRSGALARFSPIMDAVRAHADRGGFIMGLCNGFQILLESGLLPGAMLQNASQKFVCREVTLEVKTDKTPFSCLLPRGSKLRMPVAHHEGRYYASKETLDELEREERIVFTYVDNPNGAARDIAGIVNAKRNVMGMMPHPERAAETVLGSSDGLGIFRSIAKAAEAM
jgi:phosphoribosylformylglycinamidine synthase subunit PurQ / glutaminase